MGYSTQRIDRFRGINRSLEQSATDLSCAYEAVNVDIRGGKLSNKIGNYHLCTPDDVNIARPLFLFQGSEDVYLILRDKYAKLESSIRPALNLELGPFEPKMVTFSDVTNDSSLNIRGVGRSTVHANIDGKDSIVASGMLASGTGYWEYRNQYVDGATAKTAVYYLGDEATPVIHCRQFGSGLYLFKDVEVTGTLDVGGILSGLTLNTSYTAMSNKVKQRLVTDGIYLFSSAIGSDVTEESIKNAYMWLEVTSVSGDASSTVLSVKTTIEATEIAASSYAYLRGECSDDTVTFMQMYYGRLFAAAHRSNRDHPRRLYWSCLPGDGRTIEDWTLTEASVDTSGGHVDIGDPSDGFITGLITCGHQLLIFTQYRIFRLYGTAPSNYTLELIGNADFPRLSNPVENNGSVYWLTTHGISYYNGSYISTIDDGNSTMHFIDSMPKEQRDMLMYSTCHAVFFDNSIMFAFDLITHGWVRMPEIQPADECYILRYDMNEGNSIMYEIPAARFRQQFVDVFTRNFGAVVNGNAGDYARYETRLFQSIVHYEHEDEHGDVDIPESMTMVQWKAWGSQDFGWYDSYDEGFDGDPVIPAKWDTGWKDVNPEGVKKLQTICAHGSGRFEITVESETNAEKIPVTMPEKVQKAKDIVPRYAEGRTLRLCIESEEEFEILPYVSLLFETGGLR